MHPAMRLSRFTRISSPASWHARGGSVKGKGKGMTKPTRAAQLLDRFARSPRVGRNFVLSCADVADANQLTPMRVERTSR